MIHAWCSFFQDQIVDQVKFMRDSLRMDRLSERVQTSIDRRYPKQGSQRTGLFVAQVVRDGSVDPMTAQTILGVGDRQTRNVINELVSGGIVVVGDDGNVTPTASVEMA